MDDRPIVFCRKCCTDVVSLPNGSCPWCETQMAKPRPRRVTEQLHKERLAQRAA
jgi:hypothetical protein